MKQTLGVSGGLWVSILSFERARFFIVFKLWAGSGSAKFASDRRACGGTDARAQHITKKYLFNNPLTSTLTSITKTKV